MEKTLIQIRTDYRSLGDQIAFIGAARHFAKLHPEAKVVVTNLPEVVGSYEDDLLSSGESELKIASHPEPRHRVKERSADCNYLGTYMAELGIPLDIPPAIELPRMPPREGLIPQAYICLQPYAGFARNFSPECLQWVVRMCREACPEWPVVVSGSPETRRDLEGVDYGTLGDARSVLRTVQHAALVVTPRSASAHVASAYGVPAFIWITEDGENWHLDYPTWPHDRVSVGDPPEKIGERLVRFLHSVRIGRVDRPHGIRKALERSGIEDSSRFFLGWSTGCPKGLVDVTDCPYPAHAVRKVILQASGHDPGRYPAYLNRCNAAEYIAPEASATCAGRGLDVGPADWPLAGAVPIRDEPHQNAYRLPAFEDGSLDYVFSSHALEHLYRPEEALALWVSKVRKNGILFLYLPHPAMEYWHPEGPWGGDHKWIPSPRQIRRILESLGMKVLILTEVPDAYWSFRCVASRELL